jgi:hypothetical protein
MESSAWTGERLDDLSGRVDAGFGAVDRRFEHVDRRFERLEAQMSQGFDRVDRDIRELRGEIRGVESMLARVGGGIIVGLVGVIATLLTTGA